MLLPNSLKLPWAEQPVTTYEDLLWQMVLRNRETGHAKPGPRSIAPVWTRRIPAPGIPEDFCIKSAPLRAIVIGINDYPERSGLPKLQGAVADADAMQDWLKSTLGVPAGHIQVLRDHEATRIAILSALESWRDGPDVQQHDPLLIYFAGHGGAASIGSQALLPVDYIPGESPPILDRTFDELIMDIITKHRSAITVIFDCCFPATDQGGEGELYPVRGRALHPLDIEHDQTTVSTGLPPPASPPSCLPPTPTTAPPPSSPPHKGNPSSPTVPPTAGFGSPSFNTYVLLAACGVHELAREDNIEGIGPSGRFTRALLNLFKEVVPNQISHKETVDRLPHIERQTPRVEGYYRQRRFFYEKVFPTSVKLFTVKSDYGNYILEAGRAHGIAEGAEFAVFQQRPTLSDLPSALMMTIDDSTIKAFTTTVTPVNPSAVKLRGTLFALQTRPGIRQDLAIHIPVEAKMIPAFEAVAKEIDAQETDLCRLKLVTCKKDSQIALVADPDHPQVLIEIWDERARTHGLINTPYTIPTFVNDFHRVIRGICHFYAQFDALSPLPELAEGIKLEFFPVGHRDTNLYKGGKIEVDRRVSKYQQHALCITNNTKWNLHAACFIFDNCDFSIKTILNSPERRGARGNLPKGAETYTCSFECRIPRVSTFSLLFLKIYFALEATDNSHIPQLSPFASSRSTRPKMCRKPAWGTIVIPLLCRKLAGQ